MGKALTSASNPSEPSDRLGKHGAGGRSKAECRKSPKRESEGRGGADTKKKKPTKTRPAHGAEFLQDEKTSRACGPLGQGHRRGDTRSPRCGAAGVRVGPGAPHPAPRLLAPTGTTGKGSRAGHTPGCRHRHASTLVILARQPASHQCRTALPGTGPPPGSPGKGGCPPSSPGGAHPARRWLPALPPR